MSNLISRQTAINAIANTSYPLSTIVWNEVIHTILSMPSAEQIDKTVRFATDGKAVMITNCPNCGAPIEDGKCKYCGTRVVE